MGLMNNVLRQLANKNNNLYIIDARKTLNYDGALVASSKASLPLFDATTSAVFFPTQTPDPDVNALMQRVLDEYGGFARMKTSTKDVIIENFQDHVVVAAHIYAAGNFHFVVVSAVPREYYFGSTVSTIGGTIGGGVGLLLLACVLIVYITREQQKLVDGSRQSVEIAQEVARNLVLYNTDEAELVIERALRPTLLVYPADSAMLNTAVKPAKRPTTPTRISSSPLQRINENLTVYKPHLPEYVLPKTAGHRQPPSENNNKQRSTTNSCVEMMSNRDFDDGIEQSHQQPPTTTAKEPFQTTTSTL